MKQKFRTLLGLVLLCAASTLAPAQAPETAGGEAPKSQNPSRRPEKSAYAYIRYWTFMPKNSDRVDLAFLEPEDARGKVYENMPGRYQLEYSGLKPGKYVLAARRVSDPAGKEAARIELNLVADSYHTVLIYPEETSEPGKEGELTLLPVDDSYDLKHTKTNIGYLLRGDQQVEILPFVGGVQVPEPAKFLAPIKVVETEAEKSPVKFVVRYTNKKGKQVTSTIETEFTFEASRRMIMTVQLDRRGTLEYSTRYAGKTRDISMSPELDLVFE